MPRLGRNPKERGENCRSIRGARYWLTALETTRSTIVGRCNSRTPPCGFSMGTERVGCGW